VGELSLAVLTERFVGSTICAWLPLQIQPQA
jgi:hypothetical protein